MLCVVCMIQQAQPVACSDTNSHRHTHTLIRSLPHLHLYAQADFPNYPLQHSPRLILYTLPRLVGMVTLMGWPLLGDEESGQKEHRHGEEKAISGWAASADALLQLGNKRVKFIWKKTERKKGERMRQSDVFMTHYNASRGFFLHLINLKGK